MQTLIEQIIQGITEQVGLGGWAAAVGAVGVLITFAVRLYQTGVIQGFIPEKYRWERLTPLAKFMFPFLMAAIGTFLVGLAAQIALGVAIKAVIGKLIAAAIGAGIAAVATHQGTKAVGTTVDMVSLMKDAKYEPGNFRKKTSLIFPIDIERAKKAVGVVE